VVCDTEIKLVLFVKIRHGVIVIGEETISLLLIAKKLLDCLVDLMCLRGIFTCMTTNDNLLANKATSGMIVSIAPLFFGRHIVYEHVSCDINVRYHIELLL
jgi:hypothetical protein